VLSASLNCKEKSDLMANFILVHGAWHGAWCWRHVMRVFSAQGYRTHAVTLTGLGERVHLMSADHA
jgi:hypothetical protein